jgi:hypothetical protein
VFINTLDDYNFPTKGDSNNLKASVTLPVADFGGGGSLRYWVVLVYT